MQVQIKTDQREGKWDEPNQDWSREGYERKKKKELN